MWGSLLRPQVLTGCKPAKGAGRASASQAGRHGTDYNDRATLSSSHAVLPVVYCLSVHQLYGQVLLLLHSRPTSRCCGRNE